MTKELEALRKIQVVLSQMDRLLNDIFVANKDPIKPTLKNIKDAIKKTSTVETALKDWELWKDNLKCGDFEDSRTKALEIIVKHDVDLSLLKECIKFNLQLYDYNRHFKTLDNHYFLTKQEYDLLKEVLGNEKED